MAPVPAKHGQKNLAFPFSRGDKSLEPGRHGVLRTPSVGEASMTETCVSTDIETDRPLLGMSTMLSPGSVAIDAAGGNMAPAAERKR